MTCPQGSFECSWPPLSAQSQKFAPLNYLFCLSLFEGPTRLANAGSVTPILYAEDSIDRIIAGVSYASKVPEVAEGRTPALTAT